MSTLSITLSIAPSFASSAAARPSSTVRLTQRGRLVIFLAALIFALVTALWLAGGAVGSDEAGAGPTTEVVMVGPGDTLWGIASEAATDGDVRAAMREIQRLNALDSVALSAAQKLRIPVTTQ